jgi:hypothetical protein
MSAIAGRQGIGEIGEANDAGVDGVIPSWRINKHKVKPLLLGQIKGFRECRAFKHLDTIRRVLLTVLPPCGHGALWIGIQNERSAVHASRSHSQAERQGGFPTPPFLCYECNNLHSIESSE